MTWEPSDPSRWAVLGLADPDPDGRFPVRGNTAELLAHALIPPGAKDPIDGIVDAVRLELIAFSGGQSNTAAMELLRSLARRLEVAITEARRRLRGDPPERSLARRLEVAITLLRRIDNREPTLAEEEFEDELEEKRSEHEPSP